MPGLPRQIPLGFPPNHCFVARPMSHCKGKDNVKKRAARRKKTERLQAEKAAAAPAK